MRQVTMDGRPVRKVGRRAANLKGRKLFMARNETFGFITGGIVKEHGRKRMYALASGGKDSMYVADRLVKMGRPESVVHIQINVGLKMTTDFLSDYCRKKGWPLAIIEPKDKFVFATHGLEYGFHSYGIHSVIVANLKYITMRDYILSEDREGHALISGVRRYESKRRMTKFPAPILRDGAMWFCAYAFYLSDSAIYGYVMKEGLAISPAYKMGFGTSGECLCGSFATHDEKMLIRQVDPHLAAYIEWLEDGIKRFGMPMARRFPRWGGGAKMSEVETQKVLDDFTKRHSDVPLTEAEQITCGTECEARTMRGETDF